MTTVINSRSYQPEDIVRAIQKHLGTSGTLEGDVTHVFRTCRRWQQQDRGIPYHWKHPHEDYEEYAVSSVLPECALQFFMQVVEPVMYAAPSAHAAQ